VRIRDRPSPAQWEVMVRTDRDGEPFVASFTTKALKDNTRETEENDKDRSARGKVRRLTGKWTASEM